MQKQNVTIAHRGVANGEPPVPTEIIAESIVEIAKAMKRIEASRLNRHALVTLLQQETRLPQTAITKVLIALECLESIYCKPARKK